VENLLQVLWVLRVFCCGLLAEGVVRGWDYPICFAGFFLGIDVLVVRVGVGVGEGEVELGVDGIFGGTEMALKGVRI